ncbi:MAG: hypothetical protein VKJ02_11720 [Snowella sp.]|nr:hypothetical protein [Snowella sp.]
MATINVNSTNGWLDGGRVTWFSTIFSTFSDDFYSFNLKNSNDIIDINLYDIRGGDLDLFLYRDTNFNGVWDINDTQIDVSRRGGTQEEVIENIASERANIGGSLYFARVKAFSIDSGRLPTYRIDLVAKNAPISSPGNDSELLVLGSLITRRGRIAANATETFEYSTSANGTVIGVTH